MTIEPYFHVKDDTYCYPDSNVLRNLLGITDYDELVSAEGRLTMMAMTQLDVDPVKGCFDTEHLRTIHRCIFKDIYDWAGEFRTVEISKGIPFCYCANIQSQLDSIFAQLHRRISSKTSLTRINTSPESHSISGSSTQSKPKSVRDLKNLYETY